MRVVNTNEKTKKYDLPTTKTNVVTDIYREATDKVVTSRLRKIENTVKTIISDDEKLKAFLIQIKIELQRKPSISIKSILKRAQKLSDSK